MNDEAAFLKAICDNPNDMAPRLIYADWLEENGKSQHAEWIKKQIKIREAFLSHAAGRLEGVTFFNRNGFHELVYASPLDWAKNADRWTAEYPINQVVFSDRPNLWWECFAKLVSGYSDLAEGLEVRLYLEGDPKINGYSEGKKWITQVPCLTEMDVNWAYEKWSRNQAKELSSSLEPYRALWPKISFHLYESVMTGGSPQYFLDPPSGLHMGDLLNTHHKRRTQEHLRRLANPWDIAEQGGDRSAIICPNYRTDEVVTVNVDTNTG